MQVFTTYISSVETCTLESGVSACTQILGVCFCRGVVSPNNIHSQLATAITHVEALMAPSSGDGGQHSQLSGLPDLQRQTSLDAEPFRAHPHPTYKNTTPKTQVMLYLLSVSA